MLTSKTGTPILGYQLDTSEGNVHSLQDSLSNSSENDLTISVISMIHQLSSLLDLDNKDKPLDVMVYVDEIESLRAITVTSNKNAVQLGQYILTEAFTQDMKTPEVHQYIESLIQKIVEPDIVIHTQIRNLLLSMQEELSRYVSFIVAFDINSNELIASTLPKSRKKENLLAEAVYKELVNKVPMDTLAQLELKIKTLGDLQTFYFTKDTIAYVIYSAQISINTGIIRLKLNAWLKKNLERFPKLDSEESLKSDTVISIPEMNKQPEIEIKIRFNQIKEF
ncbi:MAG: hypothetical protein ACXAC7_07020 [Candidatus Hodarchaeales archaeon]|jgi:hypothetical protein